MARVLCISSHVAYGTVGNAAAVPALQAKGHEVLAVPTVALSNHPGLGEPAGFRTTHLELAAILDRLAVLAPIDAVMTGYFATAKQVTEVARVIAGLRAARRELYVLIDPIIGDGGSLYVPQPVAEAIRGQLAPLATCLTPNRFELEWLTGWVAGTIADAISAARALNVPEVVATSIPAEAGRLANLVVTPGAHAEQFSDLKPNVPHGTGDFLAGAYLAERLPRPPAAALARAMQALERAIRMSEGSNVLNVAGALHGSSHEH